MLSIRRGRLKCPHEYNTNNNCSIICHESVVGPGRRVEYSTVVPTVKTAGIISRCVFLATLRVLAAFSVVDAIRSLLLARAVVGMCNRTRTWLTLGPRLLPPAPVV